MLWSLGKCVAHFYFHEVIERSDASKARSTVLASAWLPLVPADDAQELCT